MAVYFATELKDDPLEADEDEFLKIEKIPVKKAIEMAERGELPDAKSLAALFLARGYLDKYI
jgi:ADP-ribose pyrophosphatase